MEMIKVYIASKIRHAEMLRALRHHVDADGIHFNGRWVETCNLTFNSTKPVSHWQRENFDDIERAHVVFCYAETGEHLKGGLVEIGVAIRAGKPVYLIGQTVPAADNEAGTKTIYHADYEPWSRCNPEQIKRARDFGEGMRMVKQLFKAADDRMAC